MNAVESTIPTSDVARLVATEYGFGTPNEVRLMNSGVNDTYAVDLGGIPYALRIYGHNRWYITGPDDYRFEHGLLDHLHAEGVPVSVPVPRRTGDPLGKLATPQGDRYFSLFTWAPGTPGHTETLTADQAHVIGQTLAAIHVAADRYQPDPGHHRYTLGERTLLDRFVAELEPSLWHDDPSDVRFIRSQIADIRRRIRAFDPGPGGWGIVHGDVQPLNHHLTEDGHITWSTSTTAATAGEPTTSPSTTPAYPSTAERPHCRATTASVPSPTPNTRCCQPSAAWRGLEKDANRRCSSRC